MNMCARTIDLQIDYYDLGMEMRDSTDDHADIVLERGAVISMDGTNGDIWTAAQNEAPKVAPA